MPYGHIDQIFRLLALVDTGKSHRAVTVIETTVISEMAP